MEKIVDIINLFIFSNCIVDNKIWQMRTNDGKLIYLTTLKDEDEFFDALEEAHIPTVFFSNDFAMGETFLLFLPTTKEEECRESKLNKI